MNRPVRLDPSNRTISRARDAAGGDPAHLGSTGVVGVRRSRPASRRRKPLATVAILLVGLLTGGVGALHAALEEVPDYEHLPYSPTNVRVFLKVVAAERADLLAELTSRYPDRPDKVKGSPELVAYDRLIAGGNALLGAPAHPTDPALAGRDFDRLQRLHYSVLASLGKGEHESRAKRKWRMAINVAGGRLNLAVPNVIDPTYRLGKRLAQLEAARLYRPGKPVAVTAEELATLSPLEVSRLQPAPDHPAIRPVRPGHHYAALLAQQTAAIRAQGGPLARFDFSHARRIVFYDGMNEAATSPKITVKDRFGCKWMLKWGDEVHTDVAVSRIYIDLGATYTDLKFYSGPGETILIFAAPGDPGKDAVQAWHQLSARLEQSRFAFHGDRYLLPGDLLRDQTGAIIGHGRVDAAMAETHGLDRKLIGAAWVRFKECQLSLFNPAIKRLGAAALSRLGAEDDRVARGSLVFNCWVKNKDMKDDNSRVGLLFDPATGGFDRRVEFQCDLGCTLGALQPSGELNSFEKKMIQLMPQSINFIMRPLYVPAAWQACTWADARWMALRIAALTRADLERSFAESGWPPFAQRVAVERLLNRRNELVKHFKLDLDGFGPIPCDPDFDLVIDGKHGRDVVVRRGEIQADSVTVRALEDSQHPEGLARVISRKRD